MIVDWMEQAVLYKGLDPRIDSGLRALEDLERLSQEPGWHVTPDGLCYLVQELMTSAPDLSRWETHRRHTDIQYILEGEESFGYAYRPLLSVRTQDYDAEEDIEFFAGTGEFVVLKPGMFAIQFPHDAHLPGCQTDTPRRLRRGVIKIPWA